MLPYYSEFIGTFLMILLGDSVVANATLDKSGMKGAGAAQITIGWGLAVMLPACVFGVYSGAHFNPALTIALAIGGSFSWSLVPGYIIAQLLGAFLGGCAVYVLFKNQFDATENQGAILGCFCTIPSVPDRIHNFLSEIIATFVLVFVILGLGNVKGASGVGLNNLLVFGLITGIGMSFGGVTGYAINPARDLAPRLAHTLLPIKNKGSNNWGYAVVPLFGPLVGGIIGAVVFNLVPWA